MRYAIEVQDLRKSFGEFQAVQGASFSAQTGEVLSLLGPNGAGKSTTISMLSGLLKPTGGEAWMMGYSVTKEIALYPADAIGLGDEWFSEHPDPRAGVRVGGAAGHYAAGVCGPVLPADRLAVPEDGDVILSVWIGESPSPA